MTFKRERIDLVCAYKLGFIKRNESTRFSLSVKRFKAALKWMETFLALWLKSYFEFHFPSSIVFTLMELVVALHAASLLAPALFFLLRHCYYLMRFLRLFFHKGENFNPALCVCLSFFSIGQVWSLYFTFLYHYLITLSSFFSFFVDCWCSLLPTLIFFSTLVIPQLPWFYEWSSLALTLV